MCGIAGIWGAGNLEQMLKLLKHRGPDGTNTYSDGSLQMGATHLKIVSPEEGLQPFFSEDKSICVVLNGQVYNYKDLKKELKVHEFKTQTDIEVIAHAYEEWGLECFNRFNGAFAVAIWDGNRLVLGRDRLGQKPLYYFNKGNDFYFASEIKSILTQVGRVSPNITDSFREFETTLGKETLFKGIFVLEPASILTYNGKKIEIKKYWQLSLASKENLTEAQAVDKLKWLLNDAVSLRKQIDIPFGMFLSGGLDSSLIAYIAKPEYVFTCSHSDNRFDETAYAKVVSKDIQAQHIIIQPNENDFKKTLKKVVWHLDQPVATASSFLVYMLAKSASEKVKVVLNGEGADELFGGYVRYLLMLNRGILSSVLEERYQPLKKKFFESQKLNNSFAEMYYFLSRRGIASSKTVKKRFVNEFLRCEDLLTNMQLSDLNVTLPSLLIMADKLCSAFGLENRSPFLDYRLVEFAFSLPRDMKIKNNTTKYILKKAARGIVPDFIIDREIKQGLYTPVNCWLGGSLKSWFHMYMRGFMARNLKFSCLNDMKAFDRFDYTCLTLELWYRVFSEYMHGLNEERI